ncbi:MULTISPECIES: type II toxin-antitoxin system HipA family toxin [Francisella]|uniref:Type II toxin-antitoxin system HipA family toxin n=1 Tax=Francisella opportunistica TaxID=2016517 RepID=A0A345JQ24_9GAMM|nr:MULTISPECIES: type II toxin-antitoxin system HipA family toxin [Francisella]APC91109.1 HipA domain protein [Francisella sp. MA067296]AXH29420.1 type II toxin-antitoxin system HipA family toxin [Francisella opportunistica]AXH31072.1 phosphatidylinositol kinase [Francisella opportunistica]AXH32717.1 phosphatidylinositol kinase [Francisella opportunistica]
MDKLQVKVIDKQIGCLIYSDNEYVFDYSSDIASDFVSLTMPVRAKDYIHSKLHPIFEMNLPEGYLLSIIKKHFAKITNINDFVLLKLMFPSIRGRISYDNTDVVKDELFLDDVLHSENKNLFDELVSRFALRSPLSGVQPKVLVNITEKATLKVNNYIIKSWGQEYKELALNEYYCMLAVKKAGIPTPEFYISDDEKLFVMKRFDILDDDSCLGFEDMCVLMAKHRDDKYDGTCEQIVKTIKTFVSPSNRRAALINFFKMTVMNYLLKNGDAHLKNFGLLYRDIYNIDLAPAYDVVCTTAYIDKDIPALHLLGSKKWWGKKFLLKFGITHCDLGKAEVDKYFDECINSVKLVVEIMKNRLAKETNQDKVIILNKMINIFESNISND